MDNTVEEIVNETKLSYCVECGKCVVACPMRGIYQQFSYELSPRGISKKVLLGFDVLDIFRSKEIWFCLGCTVCTDLCPAGVRYAEFIDSLRLLAIRQGVTEHCLTCQRCGGYFVTTPTLDSIRQEVEGKGLSSQFLALCPKCRRYDFGDKVKR